MKNITFDRTIRRKRRVSTNMKGEEKRPRICIYRSNKYIYAQAIDDMAKKTLAAFSSLQLVRKDDKAKQKKSDAAKLVGIELAKMLLQKNIKEGLFDRNRYTYNGRVKSLAEGLREGGLKV